MINIFNGVFLKATNEEEVVKHLKDVPELNNIINEPKSTKQGFYTSCKTKNQAGSGHTTDDIISIKVVTHPENA